MTSPGAFTYVEPDLPPVLEELRTYEPVFHTPQFGLQAAEFEKRMVPGYWEVGATGRRYSREFILSHLKDKPPADAGAANWHTSAFGLRRLAGDTYLLTYTLRQAERVTRRATIWQKTQSGWQIVYHQGTLVALEGDDLAS